VPHLQSRDRPQNLMIRRASETHRFAIPICGWTGGFVVGVGVGSGLLGTAYVATMHFLGRVMDPGVHRSPVQMGILFGPPLGSALFALEILHRRGVVGALGAAIFAFTIRSACRCS
jgi:H+/Cl- antiporter ClcA